MLALAIGCSCLSAQTSAVASGLREGRLEIGGASIIYQDSGGSGAAVVFLHAATGTVLGWEKQVPAIIDAGYRFIAFDRRGWGRSTAGKEPGTAADDLLALLDHLKIDRCHLLGTAAGGFVAFDFALSYPQRLRSLMITNSIGGVEDPAFLELGRRIRPPGFDAMPVDFRELGPTYRAADPEGTARWLQLEKASRHDGPRPAAQPLRNHFTLKLLETITTPTLLLTGDADLYAPPPIQQMFAAYLPKSESTVLSGAGHSGYWERPEEFNRAIVTFLGRH